MTVSRIGDAKVCVVLLGGDIATWGPLDLRGQGLKVMGDGLALKKILWDARSYCMHI